VFLVANTRKEDQMVEYRIQIPEDLHEELQAEGRGIDVSRVCVEALKSSARQQPARAIVDDMIRMFNPHR